MARRNVRVGSAFRNSRHRPKIIWSKETAGCQRSQSVLRKLRGRCTCTARTSPRGSRLAGRKCFFSAPGRDGRTAAPFVEAFLSASPGLVTRRTIPRRRRTASSAEGLATRVDRAGRERGYRQHVHRERRETPGNGGLPNFALVHRATFARQLSLELEITNTGERRCALRKHCMRTTAWGVSKRRECGVSTRSIISIRPTRIGKRCSSGAIAVDLGNRSRVLGHHRCDRTGRSRLTSAHARFEAEFTHHNGVESVGAEGTRFVGSRG